MWAIEGAEQEQEQVPGPRFGRMPCQAPYYSYTTGITGTRLQASVKTRLFAYAGVKTHPLACAGFRGCPDVTF